MRVFSTVFFTSLLGLGSFFVSNTALASAGTPKTFEVLTNPAGPVAQAQISELDYSQLVQNPSNEEVDNDRYYSTKQKLTLLLGDESYSSNAAVRVTFKDCSKNCELKTANISQLGLSFTNTVFTQEAIFIQFDLDNNTVQITHSPDLGIITGRY